MRAIKIPIAQAREVLRTSISTIGTVTEWADLMGYSRSHFSAKFHKQFGRCAVDVLIEEKRSYLVHLLKYLYNLGSDELAGITGFSNGRALCRFLRNNHHMNLTQLREFYREKAFEGLLSDPG